MSDIAEKNGAKKSGSSKKRILIIGLIIVAILYVISLFVRPQIGAFLFDRAISQAVSNNVLEELDEGLHVALCGTGSPMADPTRAGPCSAVIVGEKIFIVDIGAAAFRKFQNMGLPAGNIEAVLLTHLHSDHIDGLGEMATIRWVAGHHDTPLSVFGPQGVLDVVTGLNAAYGPDAGFRTAHHGEEVAPPSGKGLQPRQFQIPNGAIKLEIYNQDGLKITAFRVPHDPVTPAMGYRFDYKGRSIVFSGDTFVTPNIPKICNGCDIMVHETLKREMTRKMNEALTKQKRPLDAKIMIDIEDYHTSPVEAAEHAAKGKAKMLVFSHIVPALPLSALHSYYLEDVADAYNGDVVVGEDGMIFSLPANSETIRQDDLL